MSARPWGLGAGEAQVTIDGYPAAVGFALCDSVLAWHRFHTHLAWASYVIMRCYWLGQWGIARSAYLTPRTTRTLATGAELS